MATISKAMLEAGANKALEVIAKGDPVDQIGRERPFLQWLINGKVETLGGKKYFVEKVHVAYDSNYQNYRGDDQVTYNRRDTVRLARFPWASFHDGFGINEDELAENGLDIAEDGETVSTVSEADSIQIYDVMKQNFEDLKNGVQERLDEELHLDGSQDPKAVQGLDFLVSTTPQLQTVGGINAANAIYWRNHTNLNIPKVTDEASARFFLDQMDATWRDCQLYGRMTPDKIFCGKVFYDAYKSALHFTKQQVVNLTSASANPGVPAMNGGTGVLYYNTAEVTWDPTMDFLDEVYGAPTIPWSNRAYFLNSKTMKLRPLKKHWMRNRKPGRMYDRYVYYFGLTSKYRFTINKRNANAVLSVAV